MCFAGEGAKKRLRLELRECVVQFSTVASNYSTVVASVVSNSVAIVSGRKYWSAEKNVENGSGEGMCWDVVKEREGGESERKIRSFSKFNDPRSTIS